MARKKRQHSIIDLTEDDGSSNQHSKAARSSRVSSPSQAHSSQTSAHQSMHNHESNGLDDYDAGNETMYMTQADELDSSGSYEHYGTIKTKVVGIRYYDGMAGVGESVLVRREPQNRYDSNAIQVLNVQGRQIGHIPRQIAAKLAPYMDEGELLLEAKLVARPGEFDVPSTIEMYGTSDPGDRDRITRKLKQDRLPLNGIKHREKVSNDRRREALRKAAEADANSKQWMNGIRGGQGGDMKQEQTVEDLIEKSQVVNPREVGKVAEKFGTREEDMAKMPEVEQPERLATKMLPYQCQALAWLLEKEDPQFAPENTDRTTQLWKTKKSGSSITYFNIATNFCLKDKPTLARGGILADDMGLGKTLEMISLFIADRDKFGDKGPTLIVAPVSVMSNWSQQIERHVKSESPLTVYTYHGANRRIMKPDEFQKYDVVITTYGTLSVEYLPKGNTKPPKIPHPRGLYSLEWRRIVLDEGHSIRNPNTKNALAACAIKAHARWALTGTPIINSLKDLYSLIRFIGLSGGLEKFEIFNSLLIRPMREGLPESELLLQALMATFCLRRRKDMPFVDLRLPRAYSVRPSGEVVEKRAREV